MNLSKQLKQRIVEAAIARAQIPDRRQLLGRRRAKWADNVRLDAIGGKDVERKINAAKTRIEKTLSQLPECVLKDGGPFRTDYDIYVKVGNRQTRARFGPTDAKIYRITPYSHTLTGGGPLAKELATMEKDLEALNLEEDELRASIMSICDGVRTVEQLREKWPEVDKLLADAAALPAGVAALNKSLNLGKSRRKS